MELLCRTCRHFRRSNVSGVRASFGIINHPVSQFYFCNHYNIYVNKEATDCSEYNDKRLPTEEDMRQMAYILEKKNTVGFSDSRFEFVKPIKKEPPECPY